MSPTIFRERGFRVLLLLAGGIENACARSLCAGRGQILDGAQDRVSPELRARAEAISAPYRRSSRNTRMKSQALGNDTSDIEVTNISQHGFWLLLV